MIWSVYELRVEGAVLPFYIGCTARTGHERFLEHRSHKRANARKAAIIARAAVDGREVITTILDTFPDKTTAEQEERRLIAQYGRHPAGPLTNKNDGGEGGSGVCRSDTRLRSSKAISAFNERGEYVSTYSSAREAAKALDVGHSSISQMLNKGSRSVKSRSGVVYQFRFGKDQTSMDAVVFRSKWHAGSKIRR